eukprot:s1_g1129.t1
MRWLFLINLLAVVLLSGAVAIVIEGTPVGTAPSTKDDGAAPEPISAAATASIPSDAQASDQVVQTVSDETAPEVGAPESADGVAAPEAPIPLPAPRAFEAVEPETDPAPTDAIVAAQPEEEVVAEPIQRTQLPPLIVATEGDFAPFNFVDADGRPGGFDIDVATELCRRLEKECRFVVMPWDELIPALTRGDVDLVAASLRIPSTRLAGVTFSDPYYGSRGRFVGSSDAATSEVDLVLADGAQIAVQQGSLHEAYLKARYPGVELVGTRSLTAALRLVAEGRVERAFGDNAAILQWMRDEACCAALGNPIGDETYFGEGIGLVVRDTDKALLGNLNIHLQSMLEDGTSANLSAKYFSGSIY